MMKENVSNCGLVPGQIIISKAGHDRGKIYAVIKTEADGAWLADGKLRTIDRPKFKNRKHIQKTHYMVSDITGTAKEAPMTDLSIYKCIKVYASKLKINQEE